MPLAVATLPEMPKNLREHAEFACEKLQRMALEISGTMSRFQLKLADRQCRMSELSQRCQDVITILTTAMYGARHDDPLVRDAADMFCQNLHQKLLGRRPTNHYFRRVTELAPQSPTASSAPSPALKRKRSSCPTNSKTWVPGCHVFAPWA